MVLRGNRTVIALVLAYLACVWALAGVYGFPVAWSPLSQVIIFACWACMLIGPPILWGLARDRPESPIAWVRAAIARWRIKERLATALPALIALAFLLPAFGSLKSAIPVIRPFALDPVLADWDEALHGGPAWELIQPLVGHPIVTAVLSLVYQLWIAAFYLALVWACGWVERRELRRRFLVAFILCWAVLGSFGAIYFSSVGPCFYEYFYHDGRFAPLMAYLNAAGAVVPNMSLEVQRQLIDWHQAHQGGLGRGISAMPSMHVSIACLLALLGWSVSRTWGIAGTVFTGLILVGSVHLGYHYAIDGYVSLAATPVLWWIAGRTVKAPRVELQPAE